MGGGGGGDTKENVTMILNLVIIQHTGDSVEKYCKIYNFNQIMRIKPQLSSDWIYLKISTLIRFNHKNILQPSKLLIFNPIISQYPEALSKI